MKVALNGWIIRNVERGYEFHNYMVARWYGDQLWFWDFFEDEDEAIEEANEIGGQVIPCR